MACPWSAVRPEQALLHYFCIWLAIVFALINRLNNDINNNKQQPTTTPPTGYADHAVHPTPHCASQEWSKSTNVARSMRPNRVPTAKLMLYAITVQENSGFGALR